MGSGVAAAIIPASNALTSFFRDLETGILRGVSSVVTAGNPAPTDTWVTCFVSASGSDLASAILHLYSGYITTEDPLSWDGFYRIVGSERVVTSSRSIVVITLQTIVSVDIG